MRRFGLALALVCACVYTAALAQNANNYTYGNRPIDLLPKSESARPESSRSWDDPEPATHLELALHTKDLFRVGADGLERLCVIEARRPDAERRPLVLRLRTGSREQWQAAADWIGSSQRLRPCWLPVTAGAQRLALEGDGEPLVSCRADLAQGAPAAMLDVTPRETLPPADYGLALLAENEFVCHRSQSVKVRLGLLQPPTGPLRLEIADRDAGDAPPAIAWPLPDDVLGLTREVSFSLEDIRPVRNATRRLELRVTDAGRELTRLTMVVHTVDRLQARVFGAAPADLRYTLPVADGDRERTWDELWADNRKRDVVVAFPGSDARLVFWRGTSYVPCWALPEGWLTYEWLEAEPYFFGADDCVEPLQDRDCVYSQVEIVSTSMARTVVKWSYALTDFQNRKIRDEHAEEIWTLYPDGFGTRFLRGFYEDGWHENQEFIVVNRPGRRASQALDPQALTLYSPSGEKQTPVWPKPGFSVEGWPQIIALVNLGDGPRPFMVTPDAPQQVKVWAKPYVDKLDLFNSYPHWPVTRGMRTSWLGDPRQFDRPTHSNLANFVNRPLRETDTEKDWVWLVGIAERDEEALAAARNWLQPATVKSGPGLASAQYDQLERAFIVQAEAGATACEFDLLPGPAPLRNFALLVRGLGGAPTRVTVPGAAETQACPEAGQWVVWVKGQFDQPLRIKISCAPAG